MTKKKTVAQKLRDAQAKNGQLIRENDVLREDANKKHSKLLKIQSALFDDKYSEENPILEIERRNRVIVSKKIEASTMVEILKNENEKLWDFMKMQADDPRINAQASKITAHAYQIENMPPEQYDRISRTSDVFNSKFYG